MGMLSADENDDLVDVRLWHQHPEPVFRSRPDHGVYGPGHDSFFVSPDGTEDWFVYHAKTTDRYTYEGRTGRPQRLTWRDGIPRLRPPAAVDDGHPAARRRPRALEHFRGDVGWGRRGERLWSVRRPSRTPRPTHTEGRNELGRRLR